MSSPVILLENFVILNSPLINTDLITCLRQAELIKSKMQRLLPAYGVSVQSHSKSLTLQNPMEVGAGGVGT